MKKQLITTLKITIVGFTVLSLCAAPALRAVQISNTIDQLKLTCNCCCCDNPTEELNCPIKSLQIDDRCCCEIGQQAPINSAPVISTVRNDNQKESAVGEKLETNSILAKSNDTRKLILSDELPKKHPPLFILNASLLI